MEFTKQAVKELAGEMEQALQAVAGKHGLTVKCGGGKYDPTAGTFSPKVEFANADSGQKKFEQSARLIGLDASDFGVQFQQGGKLFRISGINLRAPKYPVLAVGLADGKTYKFPERIVQLALGKTVSEPMRIEVL